MGRQHSHRARRDERGFSLIELLIVIVILGLLATVVVLSVGGVTDTGQTAACKTDRSTMLSAIEAYRAQNQAYPASEAAMVPTFLHSQSDNYDYDATTHAAVPVAPCT